MRTAGACATSYWMNEGWVRMKVGVVAVRSMEQDDWDAVREIYRQGISAGNATFATTIPSLEEWDAGHHQDCRLIACLDGEVVAWAAPSPVSSWCVYGGVAEVSIYVAEDKGDGGIGQVLLSALVEESEKNGF